MTSGVDTVTFLLDQMEQGNIGLSSISLTKGGLAAKKDLSTIAKTGALGGKAVKIMTVNGLALASDKLSIVGNTTATSYAQTSSQIVTLATVTGIGGAVVAIVNDGVALYQRGCELHQIKKDLEIARKERPDSLTCRFLERKRELQRWLVASSVIGVVADGASLAGALYATAGLGATVGSTAVSAVRMMGEDHLHDNFKEDLQKFVAEFNDKHPLVVKDPHFEEHYQTLKQQYEDAKAALSKAEKAQTEIHDKILKAKKEKAPVEEQDALSQEQQHIFEEYIKAAETLKHVEAGYKSKHAVYQDLQSYKECVELLKDLGPFFDQRAHVKPKIAAFEEAYKKETGDSFEPYKTKHFGEINPAWQKRYDAHEARLKARQQSYAAELSPAQRDRDLAQKELRAVREEISGVKSTIAHNNGSMASTGYARNERIYQASVQKLKVLEKQAFEAWSKFEVEDKNVRAIREKIEKNQADQESLKQYAKNWKSLSEAREKIIVKNRGLENEQAIRSADKTLGEQLPTETLLSDRNRFRYEQYKALRELDKAEEPGVENDELDITQRGTVEEPVRLVEKQKTEHVALKDHHPAPIQTKFVETDEPVKLVTPTAKDDNSPTEPEYSQMEELFRTKTPRSPLSPPSYSVKTASDESSVLSTKKVLVSSTKTPEISTLSMLETVTA